MDLRLIVDGLGDARHIDNNKHSPSLSPTNYSVKSSGLTPSKALSSISDTTLAPISGCVSPPASPPGIHRLNIRQSVPAYATSPPLAPCSTNKMATSETVDHFNHLPERYSHPKHSNPPLIVPSSRKKGAARTAKYPGRVPMQLKSNSEPMEQQERSNSFPAFIPIVHSPPNSSPSYNNGTERYPSPPQISPSMPRIPLCNVAYPLKQGYVHMVPPGCVVGAMPLPSPQSAVSSPISIPAPAPFSRNVNAPNSTGITCSSTPFYPPPPVYHPPPEINQGPSSPNLKEESPQHVHTLIPSSPIREGYCYPEAVDCDNPNNSSRYWRFVDESSRDSGKPTVTANSLKQHILVLDADTNAVVTDKANTTAKKFKYGCQQCGRAFFRKSDLVRHIQIHLGIKPNACGVCGKQFIQRSALTVHLRVHTGEKPFGCPRCGRAFSDSSSLARHRRIHERNANAVVERMKTAQSQVSVNSAK